MSQSNASRGTLPAAVAAVTTTSSKTPASPPTSLQPSTALLASLFPHGRKVLVSEDGVLYMRVDPPLDDLFYSLSSRSDQKYSVDDCLEMFKHPTVEGLIKRGETVRYGETLLWAAIEGALKNPDKLRLVCKILEIAPEQVDAVTGRDAKSALQSLIHIDSGFSAMRRKIINVLIKHNANPSLKNTHDAPFVLAVKSHYYSGDELTEEFLKDPVNDRITSVVAAEALAVAASYGDSKGVRRVIQCRHLGESPTDAALYNAVERKKLQLAFFAVFEAPGIDFDSRTAHKAEQLAKKQADETRLADDKAKVQMIKYARVLQQLVQQQPPTAIQVKQLEDLRKDSLRPGDKEVLEQALETRYKKDPVNAQKFADALFLARSYLGAMDAKYVLRAENKEYLAKLDTLFQAGIDLNAQSKVSNGECYNRLDAMRTALKKELDDTLENPDRSLEEKIAMVESALKQSAFTKALRGSGKEGKFQKDYEEKLATYRRQLVGDAKAFSNASDAPDAVRARELLAVSARALPGQSAVNRPRVVVAGNKDVLATAYVRHQI